MNTQTIGLALIAVIIIGGGFWYLSFQGSENKDNMMMENSPDNNEVMMEEKDSMKEQENDSSMMENETMMKAEGEMMMSGAGSYESYNADKIALAEEGDVLLFFHADWCPSCRAIESEINALGNIPNNLHILKVDYDNAISLRQKYGVTTQHTFVQVNAEGELIQKFNNATTIADVFARVK